MNIKQIRLMKNITQKQLAEEIGVDHTIVSKYEKGTVSPSPEKLNAIAKVLEVSVDELLSETKIECKRQRVSKKVVQEVHERFRKEVLADWIIKKTKGHCELCGEYAPFEYHDKPYLEYHYIKPILEGGKQDIDNMVVLCPNCHKKVTMLKDSNDINKLKEIAKNHLNM